MTDAKSIAAICNAIHHGTICPHWSDAQRHRHATEIRRQYQVAQAAQSRLTGLLRAVGADEGPSDNIGREGE